ncbi:hypothetical protein NCS55_00172900 [Fusarium keratoplasticum]|nr:hypothetical protein NCS55_00172900 [Fusarium keratoplasticum]
MNHRDGDAFDRVHPDFVDLMFRVGIDPPINPPSEDAMARSIYLAIQMANEFEQAELVSRIIPEEELAAERLAKGDFRNLDHRITLDEAERLAALRATPEPDRQVERRGGNLGECIICGEGGYVRAPCNCVYCYPCLRELIRRGLTGLTEFPPRCCVHFREETIRLAQRPALVHLFRQLQEESEVPLPDRLYCHDPHCAAFIPLDCDGECLICEQSTCQRCGGRDHGSRRCDEGEILEDVWEMMDRRRIVNCPGCGIMVQLAEACNHITCVTCRAEFCLICGERWKTCDCELYGGHNHMVPMRRRPGRKPDRYRRAPRNVEVVEPGLRIPQLRPRHGEEDRGPRVTEDMSVGGEMVRTRVLPMDITVGIMSVEKEKKSRLVLLIDRTVDTEKESKKRTVLFTESTVNTELEKTTMQVLLIDLIIADIERETTRKRVLPMDGITNIEKERKIRQVLFIGRIFGRTVGLRCMKDLSQSWLSLSRCLTWTYRPRL